MGRHSLGFRKCADKQLPCTLYEGSQELNFSNKMSGRTHVSAGIGAGTSLGQHCAGRVVFWAGSLQKCLLQPPTSCLDRWLSLCGL